MTFTRNCCVPYTSFLIFKSSLLAHGSTTRHTSVDVTVSSVTSSFPWYTWVGPRKAPKFLQCTVVDRRGQPVWLRSLNRSKSPIGCFVTGLSDDHTNRYRTSPADTCSNPFPLCVLHQHVAAPVEPCLLRAGKLTEPARIAGAHILRCFFAYPPGQGTPFRSPPPGWGRRGIQTFSKCRRWRWRQ